MHTANVVHKDVREAIAIPVVNIWASVTPSSFAGPLYTAVVALDVHEFSGSGNALWWSKYRSVNFGYVFEE